VLLASLAFGLVGCNARPPTAVDSSDVESLLYWSRALDHKRVALEGYINLDNGPTGAEIAGAPQLRTQPYGAGEAMLPIATDLGTGPNQVGAPGMTTKPMFNGQVKGPPDLVVYDPEKLAWQDAKGGSHPMNHRVRVIGELRYSVPVDKDSRSPIGQRFHPFLAHVTFEDPGS
jgi:hypothetical protein